MFAWSRTWWAEWHGILFNFEWRRDRSYFLDKLPDVKIVCAKDAYDHPQYSNAVRVEASSKLGANRERKERIKTWHENR